MEEEQQEEESGDESFSTTEFVHHTLESLAGFSRNGWVQIEDLLVCTFEDCGVPSISCREVLEMWEKSGIIMMNKDKQAVKFARTSLARKR